ncbi:hypothetical protein PFUM301598_57000 [Pseudomonas fluorescens]
MLAKTVCQSPDASPDTPLSRASPLPQVDRVQAVVALHALIRNTVPTELDLKYSQNVGAGLIAKTVCQSPDASPDTPLSRASPLPQVDRVQAVMALHALI